METLLLQLDSVMEPILYALLVSVPCFIAWVYLAVREVRDDSTINLPLSTDEACHKLANFLMTQMNEPTPVTLFSMPGKSYAVLDLSHPKISEFTFWHEQRKYVVTLN